MNVPLQKILRRMGSHSLLVSFVLGLIGVSTSAVFAQTAAPSLNISNPRTCGSPISVTATCQSGNTAAFVGTGGSASGNIYTFTAPGSYTLSATCTGSSGTSGRATPVAVTIVPPTSPPTLSPSSATVAQGGTPVVIVPTGCTGGYISYFGTMGVNRDGNIVVPTGTAGVITISAICTLNNCRSNAAVANVTVTPSSAPVPTPTVVNPIPSQTGTVGTTFTFLVPTNTFSDPNNDPLTLTASGLPAPLTFNGLFITGPLNVSGTFPITINAANNRGGSVSAVFSLVVGAPVSTTGGPLQLLTPTYNSCTRAITFNTTGGNGTPITYQAIGVQRANNQSPTGVVEAPVVADNKTLTISATQSGITVSITFTPPACTQPPTSTTAVGGSFQIVPPTYNPCTREITINTTGGNGTPITYSAVGVQRNSPQSPNGIVELGVVLDGKSLNISATQSGTTVAITFTPPTCTTTTQPPTSTTAVGSSFQMQPPTYDPCTRVIILNTTGGNGTQITYSAVGVQRSSPQSNSGVVELGVVLDNKSLNLSATQSGTTVSISFLPPRCQSSASSSRNPDISSRDKAPQIVVLGNPANGTEITIEIAGAENQPLQVRLVDPQGQAIYEQTIQSAQAVERVVLPVKSSQKGLFIIQAISNGRASATKVLHQ